MEEDRSALFKQLQGFSQRKLKKVETKVVTGLGEQLVEKRGAKGLQVLSGGTGNKGDAPTNEEPARKLDLQVGFILPGLLIGSQDVAHDKSSLDSYGIEYILNLDSGVENKYEDDYNYKNVPMKDKPDYDLDAILDDCFDFIDEGRHRGNVLVHCSGTTGLSRSTSICIAYLMKEEKQSFADAFNTVKEARSFVKPNDGFIKQLKDYEVKLRGAQKIKESGIDDPFALRKKQEIEQEKAMVAGAASVKNRMKMFGATLDTGGSASPRSKSVSPMPGNPSSPSSTTTTPSTNRPQPSASKWATTNNDRSQQSKSMTPEPRKSDWQSSRDRRDMPPPPPPPMPASSLHANDKSVKPMNSNASSNSTSSSKSYTSAAPPPPPPQPPAGTLLRDSSDKTSPVKHPASSKPASTTTTTTTSYVKPRKPSVSESSDDDSSKSKLVFGVKPPPPMKIRGGLSIERNDQSSTSDKKTSGTRTQPSFNRDQMRNFNEYDSSNRQGATSGGQVGSRCSTPLVLTNNVTPSPPVMQSSTQMRLTSRPASPHIDDGTGEPFVNPFEYWQKTLKDKAAESASTGVASGGVASGGVGGAAPKRTVSLGPRRPKQVSATLQRSPFLREPPEQSTSPPSSASAVDRPRGLGANTANLADRFNKAARELQSSLTELNVLIDSPEIGSSSTLGRRVTRSRAPMTGGVSTQDLRSSSSSATTGPSGRSLNPGLSVRIDPGDSNDPNQDDDGSGVPKWQWRDDLANWKMSSSVNDLKSMFQQPSTARLPPATPSVQSATRPPLASAAIIGSSFKDNPWLSRANQPEPPASNNDYTIRRTTSISTSSITNRRPPPPPARHLRNPYRSEY